MFVIGFKINDLINARQQFKLLEAFNHKKLFKYVPSFVSVYVCIHNLDEQMTFKKGLREIDSNYMPYKIRHPDVQWDLDQIVVTGCVINISTVTIVP